MLLHNYPNEFKDLVAIVADQMHLPESAIERDYYIVYLLKNLVDSEYSEKCVFKGGTSLSKCYPGSIERFSEDIDLTFLGMDLSDKECDRMIKRIESVMTSGAETEKINAERSNRSKSMFVWFNSKEDKIKLEIGSSVRPDPYSKKSVKTYIQDYLESRKIHGEKFTEDTPLFSTTAGERLSIREIQQMLKKYVNASLKRSDISVHKLRSSFAMEFYKHEKNILVLQQRMGHRSINATNIYARASDKEEAVKSSRNWRKK